MLAAKVLYISTDRCRVADFVEVTRCFRCHGYGHNAASGKCPELQEACASCAGFHATRDCPLKGVLPAEPKQCVNCKRANLPQDHAVDNEGCPFYRKALKRFVDRVNPRM